MPQHSFGRSSSAWTVISSIRAWEIFIGPGRLVDALRRRPPLPPDGGVEILDLLERLRVDTGGEVLPAVVGDQEDDVAGVELTGDAGGDAGDGAAGDAGEDALLLEQLLRPDDRVAVGDHDFAVEKVAVVDRRDEAVVERAEALDQLSL